MPGPLFESLRRALPATASAAVVVIAGTGHDAAAQTRWVAGDRLEPQGTQESQFGADVAMDAGIAVIGAPGMFAGIPGEVYVYDAQTWELLHVLKPSDSAPDDRFGEAVALDGVTLAATTDVGPAGRIHVFDALSGAQRLTLEPEPGLTPLLNGDLALDGDLLAAGVSTPIGPGVMVFDIKAGVPLYLLSETDEGFNSLFGTAIALEDENLVIGAPYSNLFCPLGGAVYVYDAATADRRYVLPSPFAHEGESYGWSVALEGAALLIGAPNKRSFQPQQDHVYVHDVYTQQLLVTISSTSRETGALFGMDLDVHEGIAVVSEHAEQYAAHFFDVKTGDLLSTVPTGFWASRSVFEQDRVAIHDGIALFAEPNIDVPVPDRGAAVTLAPPTTLRVAPYPLWAGDRAVFTLAEARPDEPTWMLYSLTGLSSDGTWIRTLGVIADLDRPAIAWGPRPTDAEGRLSVETTVPRPPADAVPVWFQAVQSRYASDWVPSSVRRR